MLEKRRKIETAKLQNLIEDFLKEQKIRENLAKTREVSVKNLQENLKKSRKKLNPRQNLVLNIEPLEERKGSPFFREISDRAFSLVHEEYQRIMRDWKEGKIIIRNDSSKKTITEKNEGFGNKKEDSSEKKKRIKEKFKEISIKFEKILNSRIDGPCATPLFEENSKGGEPSTIPLLEVSRKISEKIYDFHEKTTNKNENIIEKALKEEKSTKNNNKNVEKALKNENVKEKDIKILPSMTLKPFSGVEGGRVFPLEKNEKKQKSLGSREKEKLSIGENHSKKNGENQENRKIAGEEKKGPQNSISSSNRSDNFYSNSDQVREKQVFY